MELKNVTWCAGIFCCLITFKAFIVECQYCLKVKCIVVFSSSCICTITSQLWLETKLCGLWFREPQQITVLPPRIPNTWIYNQENQPVNDADVWNYHLDPNWVNNCWLDHWGTLSLSSLISAPSLCENQTAVNVWN